MLFRDPQHWLFSVKTFVAAVLALLVSFWLDLPRPYWALATVYIASQPLAGATRSKATYRAIGTFVGAAAAVAMVPNLVNAPLLLVLAIAAWSGLCLYLSLLDRTPRGYAFMLAGYTAAIVGFPTVDAPGTIFDVALSRTEEILVGIVSAALVSSLLFPRAVSEVVAERVNAWLSDAKTGCRDALGGADKALSERHWLRLLANTAQLENLAGHLPFEGAGGRRVMSLVRRLLPRMLMILPLIAAINDRRRELALAGSPSPRTAELTMRLKATLDSDEAMSREGLATLREEIEQLMGAPLVGASWRDLTERHLLLRLRDLLDLFADCQALVAAITNSERRLPKALAYPIERRIKPARHDDRDAAALAGFALAAAIVVCCLLWIAFEWRQGADAAMMAAISGSLFAAQDDPTPSIAKFARWSFIAVCLAGVYVFGVLPKVHAFETLMLALAPAFLGVGLLIAEPATVMIGLPLGILTPTAMALQEAYSANFEGFLNSGLAMVAGMGLSAATTAVVRAAGAQARTARFLRANRLTLAQVANARSGRDEARAMGQMFDRLASLAPIAHAANETLPDAMRQLRAGFNLLDARRGREAMAPFSRRAIDALLVRLQRDHQRDAPPSPDALAAIDRALRRIVASKAEDKAALPALVGLRSSLFPEEPPPQFTFREANA